MNVAYSLVFISLLLPGLSAAQTRPASTQPASTSATRLTAADTTAPAAPAPRDPVSEGRRLQRLYDEYHSVSKTSTTTTPGSVSTSTAGRPTAPSPYPQSPTQTGNRPGEMRPVSAEERIAGVRIGVRGGITYPVYLENLVGITLDPVVGFVGGLVFNFGAGKVSFQPEINYSRTCFRTISTGIPPAGSITFRRAADQFEVPLLLKFATGSYAGSRFFVNVGPYGSYLSSASTEGRNESLDGLKGRFGFGAAAGIGTLIKAGPGHVSVEVRGLYRLGDTDQGFVDSRAILSQATLGYVIPLGGR